MSNYNLKLILVTMFMTFHFGSLLLSQNLNRTISGFVTKESSGENLFGARVYDTISRRGTLTNEYGFYSLTIPAQEVVLRVSYFGLDTKFIVVSNDTAEKNIALEKKYNQISKVKVSGGSRDKGLEETNSGVIDLSLKKVDKLPVFLGEKDVLKTLQLLPGVSTGSEGSSGLYVRGGGPDQNLILLDGVPIYNASHLFGFFSVFNADALSKVTLTKGGFPARYGGRASSALDMRMREGNLKHYNVQGSVGLISSKILVEGPIKKGHTGFIVNARRTYIDALTKPFMKKEKRSGYYFFDLNAKIHSHLHKNHHLYLSGYFGKDKAGFKSQDKFNSGSESYNYTSKNGLGWGNSIGALRWNYRMGPRLFSNTVLSYSHYQFRISADEQSTITDNAGKQSTSNFNANYFSDITDWAGKTDFTFVPNSNNYIKFGAGNTYHIFKPGAFSLESKDNNDPTQKFNNNAQFQYANEAFAYIENDHRVSKNLKINYGLHWSAFLTANKTYNSFQPRVSGNVIVSKKSSVKFSYAKTTQFLHLLSNTGTGLPTDLWVPATDKIGPVDAQQVSLGYTYLFNKSYKLTTETYYKKMDGLIQYKGGVAFIGVNNDWQEKVEVGKGTAYGSEIFLEKKLGKLTGWLGYTLSWVDRKFENINNGKKFPYTYDRRHDISVAATYTINDRWDLGAVFVYGTGRAVSLPAQSYSVAPNSVLNLYTVAGNQARVGHISAINGYRMPAYHRLDIGANYKKDKKWGESTWSFSIYNVYSRQNPFYIYIGKGKSGNNALKQVSLFPIIPSVSWSFKFNKLFNEKK